MNTRWFRRSSEDDGAVLVEFALVAGLFFMLVFGMVDYGLAINTKTQLTNAGREGARLGTVTLDAAAVEARVREAGSGLDQTILGVTVKCEEADDSPCMSISAGPDPVGSLSHAEVGDSIVVILDYTYNLITPLPNFVAEGNSVSLQSVTEMRVEK
ncbi:MAG: pilus assembly protein [Acidimicrobiia bacterium]|nr:pilus assembly protein [Acidimicrobiia bacterium]